MFLLTMSTNSVLSFIYFMQPRVFSLPASLSLLCMYVCMCVRARVWLNLMKQRTVAFKWITIEQWEGQPTQTEELSYNVCE